MKYKVNYESDNKSGEDDIDDDVGYFFDARGLKVNMLYLQIYSVRKDLPDFTPITNFHLRSTSSSSTIYNELKLQRFFRTDSGQSDFFLDEDFVNNGHNLLL